MRDKVTRSMRQINSETKTQMREANGSIALLGETIGVHLPRHLRTFVAQLPGVASAMSAAFDAIAILALIDVVVKAGEKIAEFITKNREAAEKLRESQEGFGLTVQKVYNSYREKLLEAGIKTDELRKDHLDALHKQLELIDMQGFDQLAGAFDKLQESAKKTFDNLKSDWLDTVRTFLTTGSTAAGSSGVAASANKFNTEYQSLLAQGKGTDAQTLLNSTEQREEHIYALMDEVVKHRANPASGVAPYAAIDALKKDYGISAGNTFDFQKQYEAQQTFVRSLEVQQNVAASQRQLTSVDKQNATAESGKQASSDLLQSLETKLATRETGYEHLTGSKLPASQVMDFWAQHVDDFGKTTKEYQQVIEKLNAAVAAVHQQFAKVATQAKADWQNDLKFGSENPFGMLGSKSLLKTSSQTDEEHAALVKQISVEQAKLNESLTASATRYALATGAIGHHDAAVLMAAAHQRAFTAELDALNAQLKEIQNTATLGADDAQKNADQQTKLRAQIAQLRAQAQQQDLEDAQATESAFDQMFDHIKQGAQETSSKIAQVMEQTLDGLNGELAKLVTGQNANLSDVFRGGASSLSKIALQKAESGIVTALGLGGHHAKADGYHMWVDNLGSGTKTPGANGVTGMATHGLLGMLNDSNFFSSMFGGRLFGSGGIFSGLTGFASGGDVVGGMPIEVGENGPEVWTPPSGGHITSNRDLSGLGSSPTVQIGQITTADPVQTQMAVYQGMRIAHAHAVKDATHAIAERTRRTAQG